MEGIYGAEEADQDLQSFMETLASIPAAVG